MELSVTNVVCSSANMATASLQASSLQASSLTTANYEEIKRKFMIQNFTDEQYSAINGIYEGRDVFVATRTGSGKSLTYETFPIMFPGRLVIIIAPLTSIMAEQCRRLVSLGFKATYLGMDSSQNKEIENGKFDSFLEARKLF